MRLQGKTALVTGSGSRGIGNAIVRGFAREGADVVLQAHSHRDFADETAAELRAAGRRAEVLVADFSEPAGARALVREAISAMGGIDILVNNAATITRGPVLEMSDETLAHMLNVNVRGYFACAQEAALDMVARGVRGRIMMVSSPLQDVVIPGFAGYATSKGAVRQLARSLALELAPKGITVNVIAPGTTLTDFNRKIFSDEAKRRSREEAIPMQRLGMPDDLVGAAVFLASEEAAYMTGGCLLVDGGLSLA
ncbi:MAG: SDR family oxidoreductase [Alphaproteobacteria bacterium]|nr:SDR family oxidoreductase [Alphaproteobacteria bacterium]